MKTIDCMIYMVLLQSVLVFSAEHVMVFSKALYSVLELSSLLNFKTTSK